MSRADGDGSRGGVPVNNGPKIRSSSVSLPIAERLRGRENYSSWAFAMKMVLIREGSWSTVEVADEAAVDQDVSLRALATICLSIDPINYSLVQEATTAQEAWTNLKNAFQDSGMTRRMGLLRKLTGIRLVECRSVEEYVNEIMSTSHKLAEVGFKVDDTWLASLLLMGLPENYEPMIMGLEASGAKITADAVKSKILQDVKVSSNPKTSSSDGAFVSHHYQKKSTTKKDKSNVQCFKCKRLGHFASECQQVGGGSGMNRKNSSKNAAFSVTTRSSASNEQWIFDSGATTHMCRNQNVLEDSRTTSQRVNVANDAEVPVVAIGNVKLESDVEGIPCSVMLSNALCVPELSVNLLSISQICKKGHRVIFTSDSCEVYNVQSGDLVAVGIQRDGLYQLRMASNPVVCAASVKDTAELWHRRLGHLNHRSMKLLRTMATGVDFEVAEIKPCVSCIEGKHQRLPFKSKGVRSKEVLDLVHSDLCGPMETISVGGSRYFLTFIDDSSRNTFVYFLRSKKQVLWAFKDFKTFVETQTGKKVRRFRSDNGTEYVGEEFRKFLRTSGICHETTVPYNPEQNGLAERMNRTIVERARALLFDANLSKRFWAEAVGTAVYLINRSPTKGLPITPEEIFSGKRPDLSHLRAFGSKAMSFVPKVKRKKWDPKSEACLFVGYASNGNGYRLYNSKTDKVYVSRDVIFISESVQRREIQTTEEAESSIEIVTEEASIEQAQDLGPEDEDISDDSEIEDEEAYESTVDELDETVVDSNAESAETVAGTSTALPPQLEDPQHTVVRRSARERRTPGKYTDFQVTYSVFPKKFVSSQNQYQHDVGSTALPSRLEESVEEQLGSRYCDRERPIEGKCPTVRCSGQKLPQISIPQLIKEPETYREALEDVHSEFWVDAMESEHQALIENGTWIMTTLPAGRKALKNKWVFKAKTNADGSIERFKARLVIKGCAQIQGVDYAETYSPVVRYATIRFLMAKAAEMDLSIYQLDAVTAFLQGELEDEDIYMQQPEGFDDGTDRVCRLQKALYGLKQASRIWNLKLDKELCKMGLTRSKYDTCVYYQVDAGKVVIVTIYVDDFLIFTNDDTMAMYVKRELTKKFKMKDLGMVKQVLGLRITKGDETVAIDQESYIDSLLEKFNMSGCNPVQTPLDLNQKLNKAMCPTTKAEQDRMMDVPFRELMGSLQFLAQCTRPDICYAVNVISSFCANPGEAHWIAAKRILRYLKGSKTMKLVYSKQSGGQFEAFTDADWGNDLDSRRSTSGYVFLQNGGAVAWSSRRQPTVALSTTEAEYMALSATTQEAIWWRGFINELTGVSMSIPVSCDNISAIALAEKEMGYSPRSKHIDIRHHFVREQVELKSIQLKHVPSISQTADVLTKPVPGPKLLEARRCLGIM